MFDLKRPCVNCPFRKGQGERFRLPRLRLREIKRGPAFQCHKTVDYSDGDSDGQPGDRPQQCAGLMAVLHRENEHNQIMQVAERIGGITFDNIDPDQEAYASWNDVLCAHGAIDDDAD